MHKCGWKSRWVGNSLWKRDCESVFGGEVRSIG